MDPTRQQRQEGADKYGVSIGDVIGKHVDDAVDSVNDTAQAVERDAQNVAKASRSWMPHSNQFWGRP